MEADEPLPTDLTGSGPPPTEGPSIVTLMPFDGREPPADLTDRDAEAIWAAVTAAWHPALLARARSLPRLEPIDDPTPTTAGEVRILPAGMAERLPSGYRTGAEDSGAILVDGEPDRLA